MPVTCQYLLAHRSTQLFSPTFKSASLYLPITCNEGFRAACLPLGTRQEAQKVLNNTIVVRHAR